MITYSYISIVFIWEIIDWISFRLIGHWIDRQASSRGGLIAINTNRLGDIFIIIYLINSLYLISTHIQIIITFLISFSFFYQHYKFKRSKK